jgi:uncharacterized protein HemY
MYQYLKNSTSVAFISSDDDIVPDFIYLLLTSFILLMFISAFLIIIFRVICVYGAKYYRWNVQRKQEEKELTENFIL